MNCCLVGLAVDLQMLPGPQAPAGHLGVRQSTAGSAQRGMGKFLLDLLLVRGFWTLQPVEDRNEH